jgi:hypothetical protein
MKVNVILAGIAIMQILSSAKGQQVESYFVDLNLLAPIKAFVLLVTMKCIHSLWYWPTNIELSCCDICIYQRMNDWTVGSSSWLLHFSLIIFWCLLHLMASSSSELKLPRCLTNQKLVFTNIGCPHTWTG